MHITLVDDSIPFDGFTPAARPLGGAERAFAGLAAALARRGHDVRAYNRARYAMVIEGVRWETLDEPFPAQTDGLIAFRKPALLGSVRLAGKRLFWATQSGPRLAHERAVLEGYAPVQILLCGVAQTQGLGETGGLPMRLVAPGLRADYLDDRPTQLAEAPTALVTTHPLHGLETLLELWGGRIQPQVAAARLLVVSAGLARGAAGEDMPEGYAPLLAKAQALAGRGVEIMAPLGDAGMAELYRTARLHLYPGHAEDMVCWTLRDSQACGLPAVTYGLGGIREAVRDGQTAQVVPDLDAVVNLTVRLLTDDDSFWSMSRDARLLQRERSWDVAAQEVEALLRAGESA